MAAQSPTIRADAKDQSRDQPPENLSEAVEHYQKREEEKDEEESDQDAKPRETKRRRTCPSALASISASAASAGAKDGSEAVLSLSFSFDKKGITVAPIETTPKFGSFHCGVDLGLELGQLVEGREVDVIEEKGEGKMGKKN
ncbi:hypothetical protein J5N97_013469 [Dioscorea zingiberensis]|uniref:Uncharacterized protein n=1 Tax=Dioscorea zingiberensis TaxID=325984 RepID=A0A9D5CTD4_9LILI|nr:hypothetical protein J5N97_013469 [Dioscorea zingiberensis]